MKKLAMLALVAMLSLGVLVGCGGGSGAAKEITIEMGVNDEMKFTPDKLEVAKGETVKVTLVNKDSGQPHSFVLGPFNAKTKQVPAGKTEVVTFKADKTGEFDFFCDVAGHKEAQMVGKLIVK